MGTINMSANVEKSSKPKKAKATTKKADAAAHPPSSVMVVKAIEDLKERKGSSLAAIKKDIGCYRWNGRKIQDCENREQAEAKEDCQKGNPFKKAKKPAAKKATPKKAEKTKSSAKTKTAKPKKPVAKKPTKKPATKKAAPKKK